MSTFVGDLHAQTLAERLQGGVASGQPAVNPVAPTGKTFEEEGNGAGNSTLAASKIPIKKFDSAQIKALAKALKKNNLQISDEAMIDPQNVKGGTGREIRKEAFNKAISQLMPMTPDEIRRVLKAYQVIQGAVETPVNPEPKKHMSVQTISLDPGVEPPVITMAKNHVSTITFLDVTGQPWPIREMSWAGAFEIESPETGSHMMRIIPQSDYATGNMSLTLVGLDTPVIFSLKTSFTDVQYRMDVRIPQFGPRASSPILSGGVSFAAGDKFIASVLDGVPSGDDVERLKVSGVDSRTSVYMTSEAMYLRTPHTLLSPAWDSSIRSSDGMNVYVMSETPVLLMSDKGRVVRAYLNKEEK